MGRKKGSGEGSIYRYNNGWRGQITLGDRRVSVTGRTKKEVVDRLAEIRVEYNSGRYVFSNQTTVEEWIEYWLNKRVAPNITEQSYIRLKAMFWNHLIPVIGGMKLQDLSREVLEETYAKVFQSKEGKIYKEQTYSHSTVNALAVQFKKCLAFAVSENIISKNPHDGVQLHKLRPPKKIDAYTLEEHNEIIKYTRDGKQCDQIFYLLISTGMRFGEAAALTWDDVDLKAKSININKTAVSIHGSTIVQPFTKTKSGMRKIYVSDAVISFLEHVRSTQDSNANYRNLVVPNMRYNIANAANVRLRWIKVCSEVDIPYKGVHALRHTWATRALEKGINVKVVSSMLGHKNIITTMNIYQDALSDQLIKAASEMDDLYQIAQ